MLPTVKSSMMPSMGDLRWKVGDKGGKSQAEVMDQLRKENEALRSQVQAMHEAIATASTVHTPTTVLASPADSPTARSMDSTGDTSGGASDGVALGGTAAEGAGKVETPVLHGPTEIELELTSALKETHLEMASWKERHAEAVSELGSVRSRMEELRLETEAARISQQMALADAEKSREDLLAARAEAEAVMKQARDIEEKMKKKEAELTARAVGFRGRELEATKKAKAEAEVKLQEAHQQADMLREIIAQAAEDMRGMQARAAEREMDHSIAMRREAELVKQLRSELKRMVAGSEGSVTPPRSRNPSHVPSSVAPPVNRKGSDDASVIEERPPAPTASAPRGRGSLQMAISPVTTPATNAGLPADNARRDSRQGKGTDKGAFQWLKNSAPMLSDPPKLRGRR